jgi:ubiquinone/menaquinone biosynthesis C-methylase UbiE
VSSDHERHNRAFWDRDADDYQELHGAMLHDAPRAWGAWRVPEDDVGALGDVRGLDVLELGCGAAQWAVALAGAGARPVGLDLSAGQLRHAHDAAEAAGVRVPLVLASGEAIPLRDESLDLVFCDHGALSFCEPDCSLSEAARVLRPSGRLVFCHSTPLLYLTYDAGKERQSRTLQVDYFDMRTFVYGEGTADFQLPYGEWIRLFRRHGFVVDDLVELRAPKGGTTTYTDFVPYQWARRWPAEQIWKLHKQP